jgi:hypothetical protein
MMFIIDIKALGQASNRLSKHVLPDLPNARSARVLTHVLPKDLIVLTPTSHQNHQANATPFHQYAHGSSAMSTILSNTYARYDTAVAAYPAFPTRIDSTEHQLERRIQPLCAKKGT